MLLLVFLNSQQYLIDWVKIDIQVSLSQRDLERNVRRKFTRTVVASVTDKSIPLILSGPSVDTGDAVAQLISPSGALSVTLRSVAGEKKKHFVEVRTKREKKDMLWG